MGLTIHVDGGSRGNPGPAGAGVVIRSDDDGLVHEAGYFLGPLTNNAAEYQALIRGLQRAARCKREPLAVISDSELLVRQITGEYQVRSEKLAGLFRQVQVLLLKFAPWTIRHVRREQNRRADELANLAMDQGSDVIVFDVERDGHDQRKPQTAAPDSTAADQGQRGEHATRAASSKSKATPLREPRQDDEGDLGDSARHGAGPRAVLVVVGERPGDGQCPAGGLPSERIIISDTLPDGICIHAALALLPTLIAIQNTAPHEFAAVPTLTVRCTRRECAAKLLLSPVRSKNGCSE